MGRRKVVKEKDTSAGRKEQYQRYKESRTAEQLAAHRERMRNHNRNTKQAMTEKQKEEFRAHAREYQRKRKQAMTEKEIEEMKAKARQYSKNFRKKHTRRRPVGPRLPSPVSESEKSKSEDSGSEEEEDEDFTIPQRLPVGRPKRTATAAIANDAAKFFKVFIPDTCAQQIRISPEYIRRFSYTLKDEMILNDFYGKKWEISIKEDGGAVYLTKGWPEFVKYYDLRYGDMLVFSHAENNTLFVMVFGINGCLKEPTSDADADSDEVRVKVEIIYSESE